MWKVLVVSEMIVEPSGKVRSFEIALDGVKEAFRQAAYMVGKDKTGYEFSEGEDGEMVWTGTREGCAHVVMIRELTVFSRWQEV